MKMHTPLFIIGLLVLITPAVGFPGPYEEIILGAYGLAIMIIVSATKFSNAKKDIDSGSQVFHESEPENEHN